MQTEKREFRMAQVEAVTLFEAFGIEVFAERPQPWQLGIWFDREPGRWARLGLGRWVLGVVRTA